MAQSPIGSAYLPGYRVGASKTNATSSSIHHHGSQGDAKSSSLTKNNNRSSKLKNKRSKHHNGVKKGLVGVATSAPPKETHDAALSTSQLNNEGNDLDVNLSNGGGLQADILKDSS